MFSCNFHQSQFLSICWKFLESYHLSLTSNKTQGFRVELQVSGGLGRVTGKGQDRDKTVTRQSQDRDKTGDKGDLQRFQMRSREARQLSDV